MKCPNDNATLQMTSRDGVEIDYCPECRGVWLDRGELDKLIERASSMMGGGHSQSSPYQSHRRDDDDRRYDDRRHDDNRHHYDGHDNHHKKHKKESFLGDMFDF